MPTRNKDSPQAHRATNADSPSKKGPFDVVRTNWPLILILGLGSVALGIFMGLLSLYGGDTSDDDPNEPRWTTDENSPTYTIELQPNKAPKVLDPKGQVVADLGLKWEAHYGPAEGQAGCEQKGACLHSDEAPFTWSHDSSGGQQEVEGVFESDFAKVEARWLFRAGDPRVELELKVTHKKECYPDREAIEFEVYDRPAALGRDLKFASVDANQSHLSNRWTPHRAIAGAQDRALQIMAWDFDAMEVSGRATGGVVTLEIDDARSHPFRPMQDCSEEAGREIRIAHDRLHRAAGHVQTARMELWIGHTWGPMVSRLPEGRLAAIALIDDSLESNARRLAAVLWGHSDPSDPRHGNGGLLGHGMSITKGLPASTSDTELLENTKGAFELGLKVAVQSTEGGGDTDELQAFEPRTWLDRFQACSELHGEGWNEKADVGPTKGTFTYAWSGRTAQTARGALNMLRPAQRDARAPMLWEHNRSGETLHLFEAVPLSASRTRLLGQELSQSALERLVSERGILIGRSSLDSQNPSPLAQKVDGLLIPEPNDHFVIAGDLETRLFDMALMSEKGDLWITPFETLSDRLRAVSKVVVRPQANGQIIVKNPSGHDLKGLTLALPGHGYSMSVEGAQIGGQRDVKLNRGQRETWVWFDLDSKSEAKLTIHDEKGYRLQPLIPVNWRLSEASTKASRL